MKNSTIFTLSLLILTLGCKENEAQNTSEISPESNEKNEVVVNHSQFKSSKMKLGKLVKRNFPQTIGVSGMVDVPPQSKALINTYYPGNVKESSLLVGDVVEKGDPLVTIANPIFVDIQQEYLEIKRSLAFLRSEYERQKTLFDEKISSKKSYLKSKTDYDVKRARAAGLKKKLQMLNIKSSHVASGRLRTDIVLTAPIDGSITKINVSRGSHVSPENVVMEITNTAHLHLELTAFEKNILSIKKGQKIVFQIPEISTEEYEAVVHLVGSSIDPSSRTVKVHGHLVEGENRPNLAVGMFVEGKISLNEKESFSLPESAVVDSDGKQKILVLNKEEENHFTFLLQDVVVGSRQKGVVEVLSSDLKKGDQVLIEGAYDLIAE